MLNNINTIKKERGFTIVELLIVIVVIAVLAAITIVAYNGITKRANATKAQTNAASVQKVAEAMNADNGFYPRLISDLTTGSNSTKLPSGITITAAGADPTSATDGSTNNGLGYIKYQYCGAVAAPAAGAATGGRVGYYDYNAGAVAYLYVGTGAAGLGAGSGTVCNTWVNAG